MGGILWAPHSNAVNNPLQNGGYLNQELVKEGWCWWYRMYSPGDTVLEGLEKAAREAKNGLGADPQSAWEWR